MEDSYIWAVIIGMAVLNYLVRFPPIALISRMTLPKPILRWLSFVPAAVMGSLVALEVFRPQGRFVDPLTSPYLWAALITGITYRFTSSFLGATIAGIVAFVILRSLLS